MKAATIINKMVKNQEASINDTELLTKALHREKKLPENQAVRFMFLYGKFDIVNANLWKTGEFVRELCEDVGTVEDLAERFK